MDFRVFCLFFAKTLELSLAHSIYRKGPPFNIISEASPKNYFFFLILTKTFSVKKSYFAFSR